MISLDVAMSRDRLKESLNLALELLRRKQKCVLSIYLSKVFAESLPEDVILKQLKRSHEIRDLHSLLYLGYKAVERKIKIPLRLLLFLLSLSTKYGMLPFAHTIVKNLEDLESIIRSNQLLHSLNTDAVILILKEMAHRYPREKLIQNILDLISKEINWIDYEKVLEVIRELRLFKDFSAQLSDGKLIFLIHHLSPTCSFINRLLRSRKRNSILYAFYILSKTLRGEMRPSSAIRLIEKNEALKKPSIIKKLTSWLLSHTYHVDREKFNAAIALLLALGADIDDITSLLKLGTTRFESKPSHASKNLFVYLPILWDDFSYLFNLRQHGFSNLLDTGAKSVISKLITYRIDFYRGKIHHFKPLLENKFLHLLIGDLTNNFTQLSIGSLWSFLRSTLFLSTKDETSVKKLLCLVKEKPLDINTLIRLDDKFYRTRPRRRTLKTLLSFHTPGWLSALLCKKLNWQHDKCANTFPWGLIIVHDPQNLYRIYPSLRYDSLVKLLDTPSIIDYILNSKRISVVEYLGNIVSRKIPGRYLANNVLKMILSGNIKTDVLDRILSDDITSTNLWVYFYLPLIMDENDAMNIITRLLESETVRYLASIRLRRSIGVDRIIIERRRNIEALSRILSSPFMDVKHYLEYLKLITETLRTNETVFRSFLSRLASHIISNLGLNSLRRLIPSIRIVPEKYRDAITLALVRVNFPMPIRCIEILVKYGGENPNYYCHLQNLLYKSILYGLCEQETWSNIPVR